jgi:hypothetical protein
MALLLNSYTLIAQINPIEEWIGPYKDTSLIPNANERTLLKIVHDFNGDGILDLALCDPYFGPYSFTWSIYLQDTNHIYKYVGDIDCEDFVALKRIAPKISKLIAYEHLNAEEGFLNEYRVSFTGIKHLRRYSTKGISSSYMDSLWAQGNFIDSSCAIQDLLRNINSQWKRR